MEKVLRRTLKDGRFGNVGVIRSQMMRSVRCRGNATTELALQLALVRTKIRGWELQKRDLAGCPDFYFRKRKIALFVDGCFWHGCRKCGHIPRTNRRYWSLKIDRNRKRDAETRRRLASKGILALRIWEHDIREDLAGTVARLQKSLLARRRRNAKPNA